MRTKVATLSGPMTAPDLRLPPGWLATLRWLVEVDQADFETLGRALRARGTSVPRTVQLWADQVEGGSRELAKGLVFAVTSLKQTQTTNGHSIPEMHSGLRTVQLQDGEAPLDRDLMADRLVAMLQWPVVEDHARAVDLIRAKEDPLWDSRILTDVRPIFSEGTDPEATGWLVLHTLQLTYWNGSTHSEFFVSLDHDELDRLGRAIDRARKKEDQAALVMSKTELPRVETEIGVDEA